MFSETAYKNADACRFCWMCRHLCPIGLKTGKETNGARAKGLMVSLMNRGTEYTASMAEAMWECALCGACSDDCATGWEPRIYIREARTEAIVKGIVPANVQPVIDRAMATGNMYGAANKMEKIADLVKGLPEKADVLLYVGEVAAISEPQIAEAAVKLLKKAGVNFTIMADELPSGAYLGDLIGFVEEVRAQGAALSKAIDATGAKTVVVLDPIDARIMKHEYAEWNCQPKATVVTATSYFAELVENGALKPEKLDMPPVTFHDAGALSRDLDEVEPARKLIAAMGLTLHEMFQNRNLAKSCGGALLAQYSPYLSSLTVRGRWEDASRIDAKVMITEAPGSYSVLKNDIYEGFELKDIFVLLAEACKA